MTVRLPEVGQDQDTWGALLNAYLLASHRADGSSAHMTDPAIASQPDCTAALQAEIDAHPYGSLLLAPGTYHFNSTLTTHSTSIAASWDTLLVYQGKGPALVVGSLDDKASPSYGVRLSHFILDGANAQAGAGGIVFRRAFHAVADHVMARNFPGAGLAVHDYAYSIALRDCWASGNGTGVELLNTPSGDQAVNAVLVDGGEVSDNAVGIQVGRADPTPAAPGYVQLTLANVTVESNTVGASITEAYRVNFRDCYFEGFSIQDDPRNRVVIGATGTPRWVDFLNCWLGGANVLIDAQSCTQLTVERCSLYLNQGRMTSAVGVQVSASGVGAYTLAGNDVFPGVTESVTV